MNKDCHKTELRLNELLDERRPIASDDRLASHLRHCRKCRQLASRYEAMLAGVAALAERPSPSAAFAERTAAAVGVRSRIRRPVATRERMSRPRRAVLTGTALAASLLVCLTIVFQTPHRVNSTADPADSLVVSTAEFVALAESAPIDLNHAQLWQATGRGLAEIPVTVRRVSDQYERGGISDTLRPVAMRLGATLEALSRLFPTEPTRPEMLNGGTGSCVRECTFVIA